MKIKGNIPYFFLILTLQLLLFSCGNNSEKRVIVDFNGPAPDSSVISFHQDEAIHVAIASMTSPRESFMYYNNLLQYISEQIGMPVHYIQKESYKEVNELLAQGAVDFAFICSGAYIEAKKQGTINLLVAPVINGLDAYKSYVIANKYLTSTNFEDLKGKSFAFSDPLSHTGYNYPLKRLKELKTDPQSFFKKTVFTYGHDLSIQMVNRGIIDAAAVHGLIFDYLREFNPEKIENIKIIEESELYGIPPIVTPKNLDPRRYKLYKNIFLNLHNDPMGREILNKINIDYYIEVEDNIYDSIRKIKLESK